MHYSFLDKLLFKIFLGNNIFQEVLFDVDKFFFYKKKKIVKSLIITGLPRSGTTILLNELYKTKKFSSLTFQDLPFILSPNIFNYLKKLIKFVLLINVWEKFFKKNKKKYKRIHNDGIFVSDQMPEAFEEVFWRVFQNRKYIHKKNISAHKISEYEIGEYKKYVNIISNQGNKKLYLAKNNNNILRLNALQNLKHTYLIVTFRDPLFQSYSLYRTHKILCENQKTNNFILNYMNFLVHHEFGLNLKTLKFQNKFNTNYKNTNINFWLSYWIYVYENILKNYKYSHNLKFLAYEKFNRKLPSIIKKFNLNVQFSKKNQFKNKNNLKKIKSLKFDSNLKIKAAKIYHELEKI